MKMLITKNVEPSLSGFNGGAELNQFRHCFPSTPALHVKVACSGVILLCIFLYPLPL